MPLEDFFVDVGVTALLPGEIVTELILPVPAAAERSTYLKLAPRGRMDLAVVGVAVALVLDRGVVRRARIALGSAAPVPLRALEAEAALLDQRVDDGLIARVAAIAAEHTQHTNQSSRVGSLPPVDARSPGPARPFAPGRARRPARPCRGALT